MKKIKLLAAAASLVLLAAACNKIFPGAPDDATLLDGPVAGLTEQQTAQFLAGDRAFNDEVFTPATGLGPFFVAASCGSCHAGDGKGHPFSTLIRFGQYDQTGNMYSGNGGPQLQNRAIPGHTPEVLPHGTPSSSFTPPANTGLGFLAALTDEQILAHADPNDADGDGVSGVPNYINAPGFFRPMPIHKQDNGRYIGRFGKKAAAIDLLHQTVNAYNQDMGITSDYAMHEPGIYNSTVEQADEVPDPEVASSTVLNVVFYLRTLKAPIQRNTGDGDVQAGKLLFTQVGCAACHTPSFTTPKTDIDALSNKTFFPYTDLLLHDMGPNLDDGYTEGAATTAEWKTPALWGLGLSPKSQGGKYFLMHDGRAHSITEAIMMHGGEGMGAKNRFAALGENDKSKLLKFLESL